jgi:hypothetical protein
MKIISFVLATTLILLGCNRLKLGGGSSETVTDIPLSEVSDGNCLNIEKYVHSVHALSSGQPPTYITTNLQATSNGAIYRNFLLRLAYGNFSFSQVNFSSIQELANIHQTDCQSIFMQTVSGDMEEYKVKEAKENLIRFENNTGESYSYEWVSPKKIKVSVKYVTGDYLCNPSAKITVKIDKEYNWENNVFESVTLPPGTISDDFLSLLAEATNTSTTSFYDEGGKKILTSALKNLGSIPIRPGVENCL